MGLLTHRGGANLSALLKWKVDEDTDRN
jgi:hypothetical protein